MAGKPPRSISTTTTTVNTFIPPIVSPDNESYQRLKWERNQATQKALVLSEQLAAARQKIDELQSPVTQKRSRLFRNFSDSNGGDRLSRSFHGLLNGSGGDAVSDGPGKQPPDRSELVRLRERCQELEHENKSLINCILQCREDLKAQIQGRQEFLQAIRDHRDDLVDDVSVE